MKILKSILLVTLLIQPLSLCLYATNTSKVGSEATICAYNDSVNERKFQYYYLEALRQKMQGKYSEAADNLLRCLCLNPKKASVYSELANLNISANKSAVAKNFMKKAVELEPSTLGSNRFSSTLYQNQEFDKAAATYEDIALQHQQMLNISLRSCSNFTLR